MIRLTRQQVREVDRRAIERYGIPGIVLMENAARVGSAVILDRLRSVRGRRVMVLCGGGNNGGDGLAIARHLHNALVDVHIGLCTDPAKYAGDALANWRIVQAMKLPTFSADARTIGECPADLIVDAIFGTGLTRAPRPPFEEIVAAVERRALPVVAIDIPSGLDCDAGRPLGPCIRAAVTVTFVAEKIGFGDPQARAYTGEIVVGDIGCPRELIDEVAREG